MPQRTTIILPDGLVEEAREKGLHNLSKLVEEAIRAWMDPSPVEQEVNRLKRQVEDLKEKVGNLTGTLRNIKGMASYHIKE